MQSNLKKTLLILIFVWFGFISIIAQAISIREALVIFYGNELIIGVIFGIWLLGISIGAIFSSYITDKIEYPAIVLALLLFLIALILPAQIYFIRILRFLADVPLGQQIGFGQSVYLGMLAIMPFSLIIGFAFPLACKAYALLGKYGSVENSAALQIGNVYILEAIGSLLGGTIFTFLLVDSFSVFEIVFTANLITLVLSFLLLMIAPIKPLKLLVRKGKARIAVSHRHMSIVFMVIFLTSATLIISFAGQLETKSILKRWQSFAGNKIELVKSTDSKYANIAVGKIDNQYSLVENGKFVSAFPDEYIHIPLAHLFLSEHPDPKNILVIGGGIEGLLSEILKYPIDSLDYVQLDKKLTKIIMQLISINDLSLFRNDSRLKIHSKDGRRFVKDTKNIYDLIIINLPDPSTATLNRFYTLDFYNEAKSKLSADGTLIARASSFVNYRGKAMANYTGSIYDTLKEAFRFVLVSPGTDAYFFASDDESSITFDIKILEQRYKKNNIQSDFFISPASFELMLQEEEVRFINESLINREEHFINTDLKPVSYFHNLVLWDTITNTDGEATFLNVIARLEFKWVIATIIIFLVIRMLYLHMIRPMRVSYSRFNIIFSITLVGLTGLSLELLMIFSFQNILGYVYHQIGFLIALFMAGLAVGSYWANRIVLKRKTTAEADTDNLTQLKPILKTVIKVHLALAIVSFLLPFILSFLAKTSDIHLYSSITIMTLIVMVGVLTGMIYPLLSEVYTKSSIKIGRTAGIIDSFDHLGAFLGAVLTGIIFIPLFGIGDTCLILALLNLLPVIFIAFVSFFSYKRQSLNK